jgi:hypothetical protein
LQAQSEFSAVGLLTFPPARMAAAPVRNATRAAPTGTDQSEVLLLVNTLSEIFSM